MRGGMGLIVRVRRTVQDSWAHRPSGPSGIGRPITQETTDYSPYSVSSYLQDGWAEPLGTLADSKTCVPLHLTCFPSKNRSLLEN